MTDVNIRSWSTRVVIIAPLSPTSRSRSSLSGGHGAVAGAGVPRRHVLYWDWSTGIPELAVVAVGSGVVVVGAVVVVDSLCCR